MSKDTRSTNHRFVRLTYALLLSGVIYAQTINEPMTADRSSWSGSDYTWTLANENLATKFWAGSPIGTLNQKDNGISGDNFSVISNARLTNGQYDASFTLSLKASGGVYRLYANATTESGNPSAYYLLEISDVLINGATCTAKVSIYESSGANLPALLDEAPAPCGDGKTYHLVTLGTGELVAYVDRKLLVWTKPQNALTGQPGVGGNRIPSGNGITKLATVRLQQNGPAMYEFKPHTVKATATSLDLTWPTLNDSGVGTAFQIICRDGTPIGKVSGSEFHYMDQGLTPSTTYKYKIIPTDFYGSTGATLSFEASTKSETAPAATVPPDDVAATASNATVGEESPLPPTAGRPNATAATMIAVKRIVSPTIPIPVLLPQ